MSILAGDQVEQGQYFSYPGRRLRHVADRVPRGGRRPAAGAATASPGWRARSRTDIDRPLRPRPVLRPGRRPCGEGRLREPPLLYSSRLGLAGRRARRSGSPATSVRDRLLSPAARRRGRERRPELRLALDRPVKYRGRAMAITESVDPHTDDRVDDEARVLALCEQLLAERSAPRDADPVEFLGRQFDLGLAWVHFPEGHGGLGLSPKLQKIVNETLGRAGAPRAGALQPHRLRHGRAHGRHPRQRGAEAALPAPAVHQRGDLVPALLRARAPAPTSPACRPGRSATATSGSSTARRCGPPWPTSPGGGCSSPAPTPTPRSTRA